MRCVQVAPVCGPVPALLSARVLPLLKLIERLWRYLTGKLACHRWWNDLDRLMQATQTLLTDLEALFHVTDGPAFRLVHNLCESA